MTATVLDCGRSAYDLIQLGVCVAMGLTLHFRLVTPNLEQFQALCGEQPQPP